MAIISSKSPPPDRDRPPSKPASKPASESLLDPLVQPEDGETLPTATGATGTNLQDPDGRIRPQCLADYAGQRALKEVLAIAIAVTSPAP